MHGTVPQALKLRHRRKNINTLEDAWHVDTVNSSNDARGLEIILPSSKLEFRCGAPLAGHAEEREALAVGAGKAPGYAGDLGPGSQQKAWRPGASPSQCFQRLAESLPWFHGGFCRHCGVHSIQNSTCLGLRATATPLQGAKEIAASEPLVKGRMVSVASII